MTCEIINKSIDLLAFSFIKSFQIYQSITQGNLIWHINKGSEMILEQNYRKVAEYTQKGFKLYCKRYLANLMLQILQKGQPYRESQKFPSQINRNSNFSQKDSELELENLQNEKDHDRDNVFAKTMKNIDAFQTIDRENMFIDLSYLRYGDIVFLEVFNAGMNPSDKGQRLRVYSQYENLKYRKVSNISSDSITRKRCAFKIINPENQKSDGFLTGNSLFCLQSLFSEKFFCMTNSIKLSEFYGYEVSMSSELTSECFMGFKGTEFKKKKIICYEPVGLKLSNLYLRAQGLEINGNIEGSVFYFCKISAEKKYLQPELVRIKSIFLQKYIGSTQIQMAKLMTKKTYSNVTLEDENGFPTKENQLVFATLDFNRVTQSELTFTSKQSQSIDDVWMLNPIEKNGVLSEEQVRIFHVCSNRGTVVKGSDKTLKLSNNLSEASWFSLTRHDNKHNQTFDNSEQEKVGNDSIQSQRRGGTGLSFQIIYEQSNVIVMKNKDELDRHFLGIYEVHSQGHYKVQENKKILFEVSQVEPNESKAIEHLLEIQGVLKEGYEFIEKIGFIVDERSESIRFSVEEIKKHNHLVVHYRQKMLNTLERICFYLETKTELSLPTKKTQNIIKELKIFQILIEISKMLNLKIGKKRRRLDSQELNDKSKKSLKKADTKNKSLETPFSLFSRYFQGLQLSILETIYKLVTGNEKCSTVIVEEASFFNKLLIFYPSKIGRILQEAIKNLSIFKTKSSRNDCSELFQWAKLIETLREENIVVQKTYIDIIAEVVIDPLDRGIVPYQNKCRELLFNQRNKKKIMPRFGVESGKPTITFESGSLEDFLAANPHFQKLRYVSPSVSSFFIEDLFCLEFESEEELMKNREYVEFVISLVRLARNLCKDRNKKLLKVADDYGLCREHLNLVLNSGRISWILKMQYLLLYSSLLIDQDPFLSFERRETKCHVWSKITDYNLQNKTSIVFKQFTDYSAAVQKLKQFDFHILPFFDAYLPYSRKTLMHLRSALSNIDAQEFISRFNEEVKCFKILVKFIFESMNFGYFNVHHIKKFVSFIIFHYQSFSDLYETAKFLTSIEESCFILVTDRNQILNSILKIIELNENIWNAINVINLLKHFERAFNEKLRPMTNLELSAFCWKLLNNQLSILSPEEDPTSIKRNFNFAPKKKTTSKNMFGEETGEDKGFEEKSNSDFDQEIGKFLLKLFITHSQISHQSSFEYLIEIISKRQKRNIQIYNNLSSLLILNGKKEETLYRDYSGRVTGKILNVIKIHELINRIKTSEEEGSDDAEDEKRKKEKVVELNNLINKIRREMAQIKDEDMNLFKKLQQIIQKLDIDVVLIDLLSFSNKAIYLECISNLYKFYIEFIWENQSNKLKLSKNFHLFVINFKIQKCSVLISELFSVLSEQEKIKHIQDLFQKMHLNPVLEDNPVKENILETLYRIIKRTKDNSLLSRIKSQFAFQIFKENDYASLLTIGTNLSAQYINVICELAEKCSFVYDKIKKIYPKTLLRTIIYQENKYSERTVLLKLFYYFYIRGNRELETHEVQDIIINLVFPEIKHLPSVCQYLAMENLELKQVSMAPKNCKEQKSFAFSEDSGEISMLKRKFEELILYEQSVIEPSEQEKYWNFIYNTEDQEEMSLLNFTILLLKVQLPENTERGNKSKKLHKSWKYNQFIKYLNELCQFMKTAFKKNSNQYQRKIINKLQQILIIHEEKSDFRQKTTYMNVSEDDKSFLKQFFEEFCSIIINENLSYAKIIQCAGAKNSELNRKRAGQNVQKMVLEEQFIDIIQKIAKNITNLKQFNRLITQRKITYFFNIYRCNKVRKINIYKFLQKLFEYLQSIKARSINQSNKSQQNEDHEGSTNTIKAEYLVYNDALNENLKIESHFKVYTKKYDSMIKLILHERWVKKNEVSLELVFKQLQSQKRIRNKKTFLKEPKDFATEKNKQNVQQVEWQQSFLYYYLKKLCIGIQDEHNKRGQIKGYLQNSLLQIDAKYQKKSFAFSRVILWILKQINNHTGLYLQTTPDILRKYIRVKLQSSVTESTNTLNQILKQLIVNLSNKSRRSPSKFENNLSIRCKMPSSNFVLTNRKSGNSGLVQIVYEQIFKQLDKEINRIAAFDFNYSLISCINQSQYHENFVPKNLQQKIELIRYGILHSLFAKNYFGLIEDFLIKVICFWASKDYPNYDVNWYQMLSTIINLLDKYISDISKTAEILSKNSSYIKKFSSLLHDCCTKTIKTTNAQTLTEIKLLNLLTQFHIKFFLENQRQSLVLLLSELDLQLLSQSASVTYNEQIESKLKNFQNENYCSKQDLQLTEKCSFQVCNENKLTKKDESTMEIFVSLLIILQICSFLNQKKLFRNSLKTGNINILDRFQKSLKGSLDPQESIRQNNYIYFFKRFIGIVYLKSEEGSLISLHFKIPYLEKYCDKSVKDEILFYLARLKRSQILNNLNKFSSYFQKQLEQRKNYEKVFLLDKVIRHKATIQNLIIAVTLIRLVMCIVPGLQFPEVVFYPLIMLIIGLKVVFAVGQYKKSLNIIKYVYEQSNLSLRQKLNVFVEEKLFLNLLLIVLYPISCIISEVIGIIAVLQLINLRPAYKIFVIIIKAQFLNIFYILLCLCLITIFIGIVEWQNGKSQEFVLLVFQSFKQFYTFAVSNMKLNSENSYSVSRKFPLLIPFYLVLILIFVYKNLFLFIEEFKNDNDQKDNIERRCFICNGKNIDFENEGTSFQEHTNLEHNLWHYLYFFIYIRKKLQKEDKNLKIIELYIQDCLEKKKYDFLNVSKWV